MIITVDEKKYKVSKEVAGLIAELLDDREGMYLTWANQEYAESGATDLYHLWSHKSFSALSEKWEIRNRLERRENDNKDGQHETNGQH